MKLGALNTLDPREGCRKDLLEEWELIPRPEENITATIPTTFPQQRSACS